MDDAIADYKEYAKKYLPNVKSLSELYWPHFELCLTTGEKDDLDRLSDYIKNLDIYTKHVAIAASLRQYHYERYVTYEDRGHKHWRLGLNAIAADCQEKLKYWTDVYDSKFVNLIDSQTYVFPEYLIAKNTEYESGPSQPIINYNWPNIRSKEKAQLRNEYKRQLLQNKKEEDELLDIAVNNAQQENDNIEQYVHTINTYMHPNDLCDLLLISGIEEKPFDQVFTPDQINIQLNGDNNDLHNFEELFFILYRYAVRDSVTRHRECDSICRIQTTKNDALFKYFVLICADNDTFLRIIRKNMIAILLSTVPHGHMLCTPYHSLLWAGLSRIISYDIIKIKDSIINGDIGLDLSTEHRLVAIENIGCLSLLVEFEKFFMVANTCCKRQDVMYAKYLLKTYNFINDIDYSLLIKHRLITQEFYRLTVKKYQIKYEKLRQKLVDISQ